MGEDIRPERRAFRKLVAASSVGSALEWYDFFLYSFLAPLVFDRLFFPQFSPLAGSLMVFGSLAVGFAARPLGGVLFGAFGDRAGRKRILVAAMVMMALCTTAMGLLPGYASIGPAAPILLIVLRFCQGLAIGGQYAGAMVITVESAPSARRGFYAALIQSTGSAGVILASGAVLLLSAMPEDDMLAWGWRLPFLASLLLAIVALFVQRHVPESPEYDRLDRAKAPTRAPLLEVLRHYRRQTLVVIALSATETGFYYLVAVFALGYGAKTLGHPTSALALAVVLGSVVGLITTPFMGALSDRVGRRPMFIVGIIASAAYIWVFFALMQAGPVLLAGAAIAIGVAIVHPIMFAPEGSFLSELFATRVRMTGLSFGKQIGAVLGAGLAPIIATWLVAEGGGRGDGVIVYYAVMAALALIGIMVSRETMGSDLADKGPEGAGRASA